MARVRLLAVVDLVADRPAACSQPTDGACVGVTTHPARRVLRLAAAASSLIKLSRNAAQLSLACAVYVPNPRPNMLMSIPAEFRQNYGGNVRSRQTKAARGKKRQAAAAASRKNRPPVSKSREAEIQK